MDGSRTHYIFFGREAHYRSAPTAKILYRKGLMLTFQAMQLFDFSASHRRRDLTKVY
jgi:hypothetical protein